MKTSTRTSTATTFDSGRCRKRFCNLCALYGASEMLGWFERHLCTISTGYSGFHVD